MPFDDGTRAVVALLGDDDDFAALRFARDLRNGPCATCASRSTCC